MSELCEGVGAAESSPEGARIAWVHPAVTFAPAAEKPMRDTFGSRSNQTAHSRSASGGEDGMLEGKLPDFRDRLACAGCDAPRDGRPGRGRC